MLIKWLQIQRKCVAMFFNCFSIVFQGKSNHDDEMFLLILSQHFDFQKRYILLYCRDVVHYLHRDEESCWLILHWQRIKTIEKNRRSRIKKTISQVVSSKMFTEVKDKLVVMTRMAYKPIMSHWSRVREDSLSPFTWDVQRCRNSNFANSLFRPSPP